MPEMPKKYALLTNLRVEEISGVDKAANLYEGWLIQKSERGGEGVLSEDLQNLLDQADLVVGEVEAMHKSLDTKEGIFAAAPDDVKKAADTVRAFLGELLQEETRKDEGKPSFMARVMAALMGTSAEKNSGGNGPTDLIDSNDWNAALEQFKHKEEVGA